MKIPCTINLAALLLIVPQLGPKIFVTVPAPTISDLGKRPVAICVGDPDHLRFSPTGEIETSTSPQTQVFLEGLVVDDLLEVEERFRTFFTPTPSGSVVIWKPKEAIM